MFVGNKGQKQYLNLSKLAKIIIDFDSNAYMEKPEVAGFINMILDKYMEKSNAAISIRVRERKAALIEMISGEKSEEISSLIDKVMKEYEEGLKNASVYPKEKEQVYFRINDNNFNKIYTPYCKESDYYKKGGDFIKAVIEEYARLPFHVREKIMLQDKISKLQKAINNSASLNITTHDKAFIVRPYKIMLDEQHRYYYLVGMARHYTTEREEKEIKARGDCIEEEKIVSFRIARIKKIIQRAKPSGKIKAYERPRIEKKLEKSGVMYLIGDAETVVLRLTDAGLSKYKIRLNQRPAITLIEQPNVYKCKATRRQIHNYFFDFGDDLEIISPSDLRDEFYQRYRNAIKIYENSQKELLLELS